MRVLVTGSLGFVFSNFMLRVKARDHDEFVGVDKAVRKYNLDNGYSFSECYLADVADAHTLDNIFSLERPDVVIHGAAESFVDDSIQDVKPFLQTNVLGTQNVANCCIKYHSRMLHVSTDEVYGQQLSRDAKPWRETQPLAPRNPYAASKACAEHVVIAAHETHGLSYQITRSCNIYGPRQKKENLIPHVLHGLLEQRPIRIHGNGENFRQYLYVDDAVDGILAVMDHGTPGGVYNLGDHNVLTNNELVADLGKRLGRAPLVQHVEDRKAHDLGYLVDSSKLRALGWKPKVPWKEGIRRTVEFYQKHHGQSWAA